MNGLWILNRTVHPCSSGNDLAGVAKTEIEKRQTEHLHTVGGCNQIPVMSQQRVTELAAFEATRLQVSAEERSPSVGQRSGLSCFSDSLAP